MHGTLNLTRPKTRFAYLILTDGRCIATNHYGECGLTHTNQWAWVAGHMISEFGCEPDEVRCVETDDGDKIAVNGVIVGELVEE